MHTHVLEYIKCNIAALRKRKSMTHDCSVHFAAMRRKRYKISRCLRLRKKNASWKKEGSENVPFSPAYLATRCDCAAVQLRKRPCKRLFRLVESRTRIYGWVARWFWCSSRTTLFSVRIVVLCLYCVNCLQVIGTRTTVRTATKWNRLVWTTCTKFWKRGNNFIMIARKPRFLQSRFKMAAPITSET